MHQRVISDLFAPVLRGQDARRINALWERLFTTERVRGYSTGVQFEALAGVDIALWDLLGKALGLPVYQLLGGKYRDAQPLYRGIGGATTDALVADARAARRQRHADGEDELPQGQGQRRHRSGHGGARRS